MIFKFLSDNTLNVILFFLSLRKMTAHYEVWHLSSNKFCFESVGELSKMA